MIQDKKLVDFHLYMAVTESFFYCLSALPSFASRLELLEVPLARFEDRERGASVSPSRSDYTLLSA